MKRMILALSLACCGAVLAQEEPQVTWKRTEPPAPPSFRLFHSDMAFNIPTSSTIRKKEMQFEIGHRFSDPISAKQSSFYGLDSHVLMRLGMGYGVTDRFTITAARSNAFGNVDLRGKYRFLEGKGAVPVGLAVQAGAGWNSTYEPPEEQHGSLKEDQMQYYGTLIFNTMFGRHVAFGLAPSYLRNSDLFHPDTRNTTALGTYLQIYLGHKFSVLAEYTHKVSGFSRGHDPVALGVEMETFGHFFKIFITNSVYLNPSSYLAGADAAWHHHEWRLAFIITRLLRLGGDDKD